MKNSMLAALLIDWQGQIRKPEVARAVLFSRSIFREYVCSICGKTSCACGKRRIEKPTFTAEIIHKILLADGDWRQAVGDLLAFRGWCPALPKDRVLKFKNWAEKITARKVRGLLCWPNVDLSRPASK